MPLNQKKIASIIIEECKDIEQRCPGYEDEIIEVIGDILEYERQHNIQATNIQKKINEKCDAAARFLIEHRNDSAENQQE
ncbi:MAG: hypothetical protein ACYDGS_09085 [Thermoleophilia bacterium]